MIATLKVSNCLLNTVYGVYVRGGLILRITYRKNFHSDSCLFAHESTTKIAKINSRELKICKNLGQIRENMAYTVLYTT